MLRNNHYEVAFEAYLRSRQMPYVAVDEKQRALFGQASLKSMDFIVYSQNSDNLLIDVKGRQRTSLRETGCRENWATRDDIDCLKQWQSLFGDQFRSLFVFAYCGNEEELETNISWGDSFEFKNRQYNFYGIWVDDFQEKMKVRSQSWDTVSLASDDYQKLRAPFHSFL